VASAFENALVLGDLESVRRCRKADLHTHGWKNSDREYVREKTGRDIEPVRAPLASMGDMHRWVKTNIGNLFDGHTGRTLGIEASFTRALKDGLTRIEFGDDVWMITQGLGPPSSLVDSIRQVHARLAPHVEWIPQLGLSRHCRFSQLREWMAPWLDLGFHTVLDLSGDEFAQPIGVFQPLCGCKTIRYGSSMMPA
jgi:adenosine deaminase